MYDNRGKARHATARPVLRSPGRQCSVYKPPNTNRPMQANKPAELPTYHDHSLPRYTCPCRMLTKKGTGIPRPPLKARSLAHRNPESPRFVIPENRNPRGNQVRRYRRKVGCTYLIRHIHTLPYMHGTCKLTPLRLTVPYRNWHHTSLAYTQLSLGLGVQGAGGEGTCRVLPI